MTDEIVFYHNPQSRSQMVRWMIEEAGAPQRHRSWLPKRDGGQTEL